MAIHTPGPWHRNIRPARKYAVIFAGRNTHVCCLVPGTMPDEEVEANCNLIAAAPELLEALTELLSASEWAMADGDGQCTIPMANARNKARAARSKAVGGG